MKRIHLFLLSILLFSCAENSEIKYGFYYWRTEFSLNAEEKKLLTESTSPDFYLRLYDIDKENTVIQTLGKLTLKDEQLPHKTIVPVVFITNRVWHNTSDIEKQTICNQISDDVNQFQHTHNITIQEIQIDCDWTAQTQSEYFQFLKILQQNTHKKITCTLRLHQVKDKEQTGVPPVDKVYLMCYSTSSPLDNNNYNSILNTTLLKNYLNNLQDYPIKNMDFALPIYSWGIVTNHLGKRKLINALTTETLEKAHFIKLNDFTYKVPDDGFYFGNYLSKNFIIKIEQVSKNDLVEVKAFLNQKINFQHQYIYYHLDSKFTTKYKDFSL